MKTGRKIELVLAVVLALCSVTIIGYQFWENQNYYYVLWYTNFASLTMAAATFWDHHGVSSAVAITSVIGEFMWVLDYILYFFDLSFGRAAGVFYYPPLITTASIIMHGLLLGLALYRVIRNGYSPDGLYYTVLIFVLFLTPASIFIAPFDTNVNCAHHPCEMTGGKAEESEAYPSVYYYTYYTVYWIVGATFSHYAFKLVFSSISALKLRERT